SSTSPVSRSFRAWTSPCPSRSSPRSTNASRTSAARTTPREWRSTSSTPTAQPCARCAPSSPRTRSSWRPCAITCFPTPTSHGRRPSRPMAIRFDLPNGAHLRPLEEADAEALYRLVDANRAYLTEWLPWAAGESRVEQHLEFIRATRRQLEEDNGFQNAIVD